MASYQSILISYLETQGVPCKEIDDFTLSVLFSGKHLKNIPLTISFSRDGEPLVQIKCRELFGFRNDPVLGAQVCNTLNRGYRWLKFYMEESGDVMATVDAYIDENTCGHICLSLMRRCVVILDECYDLLTRARQS